MMDTAGGTMGGTVDLVLDEGLNAQPKLSKKSHAYHGTNFSTKFSTAVDLFALSRAADTAVQYMY
jgi:hypothetical protein